MDEEGIDPEALLEACENGKPKAIYVNPTLHNPTARTMSLARRDAIAHIARRWSIPIVEDNACGFIYETPPTPFASLAPELTWCVASLSKCLGAGLRTAFVLAPNRQSGWILASLLRCITGMASPLTVALASQWIQDGTADALARFIRMESAARQAIARQAFSSALLTGDPAGFHGWLAPPNGWTRWTFVGQMRTSGLGIVPSDAFVADIDAPEAVRICLGGPISQPELQRAVQFAAHTLTKRSAIAAPFL